MKRFPKGTKAQIMGTRLFQTMYTANQMRKVIVEERERIAKWYESEGHMMFPVAVPDAIRGNT